MNDEGTCLDYDSRRVIAIDCETTGLDLYLGARPFLVTIYDGSTVTYYEWGVDPITRKPTIPTDDLHDLHKLIMTSDCIVGQNIKFDVTALTLLFADYDIDLLWPWHITRDTLIAGHLLASNQRHDLTSMVIQYLGEDISKYEEVVKDCVIRSRATAKHDFPNWNIASKDNPNTPSTKGSSWGFDMWLPRTIASKCNYSTNHRWWTVVSEYANTDSVTTWYLWRAVETRIEQRGLTKIFQERMKLLPIAIGLEERGVTISSYRLNQLTSDYRQQSEEYASICRNIANYYGYNLELPKSGNNRSLRDFCLGIAPTLECRSCGYSRTPSPIERKKVKVREDILCPTCLNGSNPLILVRKKYLNLPALKHSGKTGEPSLDKSVLESYEQSLPQKSKAGVFIRSLRRKRRQDTAIQYMEGYKRYWMQVSKCSNSVVDNGHDNGRDWKLLHPGANPTGTDTLRWSFSTPNESNISKQEGFNLRYCFGPLPDQEWYSMDGQNLELRIPTYESNEKDLIYVFDNPSQPPYFGSYHLFVFDLLHPELFKEFGKQCKTRFESTWYQWIKNGNFAVIYGAQRAKADATYHVDGAYDKIRYRFPNIAKLSDRMKVHAEKYGYIETIPDKLIDPTKGYPILCSRAEYGGILPTTPLNYHVSGTAMWWTNACMISTESRLSEWRKQGFDSYITLQVHDELVFAMPKRGNPIEEQERIDRSNGRSVIRTSNLWRVRILQKLMEDCGKRINVPTPVSVEYHGTSWDVGIPL